MIQHFWLNDIRKEAEEEEEEEDPDIAKIKKVQSFFRGWLCRWPYQWIFSMDLPLIIISSNKNYK